jgi:hypothetical protein
VLTNSSIAKLLWEQQLLLAINSGDFYVMFQRENHFINKRLHKLRRLNLNASCQLSIMSIKQTEIDTIHSLEAGYRFIFLLIILNIFIAI